MRSDRAGLRARARDRPPVRPAGRAADEGVGRRCRVAVVPPGRARAGRRLLGALGEPRAALPVAIYAGILPRLEHELELAAFDRLVGPPPIDDPPLLAHERDSSPVDPVGD